MRDWWEGLQERERRMLLGGSVALVLVLLYGLAWLPLGDRLADERERLRRAEATLEWMRETGAEIRVLRAAGGVEPDPRPLLSLVDSTAKVQGLQGSIRRIQPAGQDDVRVSMQDASYRQLMAWLVDLHRRGVHARQLSGQRADDPGRINANITLHRLGG